MRIRFTTFAAAIMLAAAPLHAQTSITLVSSGTVVAGGYYVGPYNGLMGSPGQDVLLNCVDFLHHVTVGENWNAYLTAVSDVGTAGSHARSSDPLLYQKAAWLISQYPGKSDADIADIQETIWNLFAPAAPDPSSSYWFDQATANYSAAALFENWYVVTDTRAGGQYDAESAQEFLVVTPEPTSITLLATGLLGIFGAARRKRQNG